MESAWFIEKKAKIIAPIIAATLAVVLIAGTSKNALAATLCAGPSHPGCTTTIGAAVSAASSGDTIEVFPGTYKEEVVVTKPISLEGTGNHGQSVIIDATGLTHAIYVNGVVTGRVIVEQFTAENANREGILVENSTQVTVANNTVRNNDRSLSHTPPCPIPTAACCIGAFPFDQDDCGEGLHLRGTANSVVLDNIVTDNAGGILLTDETGANHDNLITENQVEDNVPDCGITLPSHPPCKTTVGPQPPNDANGCVPNIGVPSFGVFSNVVADNVSMDNGAAGTGIFTPTPGTKAFGNLVVDNVLKDNQQGGVVLHSHRLGQVLNNNVIVENIISGNGGDPDSEGISSPPPVGIVIFSDTSGSAAPITGTIISQNTIRDEDVDVWVGSSATNATVFLNNLLGESSVLGVKNTGTGTVSAMDNFWDCPTGPGTDSCTGVTGTVLFAPSLSQPFSGEK